MKILLAIFLSCILLSCNDSGTEKSKKDIETSNNPKLDTLLITEEVSKPDPTDTEDPDPTDSIPATLYGENSSNLHTATIVRKSLNNLFKDDLSKGLIDSFSKRFIFFEYDLNADGQKEIFAGLTGPYFCGSDGCSFYILDPKGAVITAFTVSRYPIVIDNTVTKGWKDLFIQSAGKYHIIKFDGKKYPSNPSVQPVLKLIPGDGLPRALNYEVEPYPWFRM